MPFTFNQLLLNLVLYKTEVNGATWTLAVEAWGTVLLAGCFIGYRYFREPGIIIATTFFACICVPFVGYSRLSFLANTYCFMIGALIPTSFGRAVFKRMPASAWPLFLIGTLVARHGLKETFAALMIGLIYYHKAGLLGVTLGRPVSVFFGLISYSLYLFNVLFLAIINNYMVSVRDKLPHPVVTGLIIGTVIIAVTIPVAYASWLWLEKPFIRLGRRLTSRTRLITTA
jgi:peptidoglycan/LPS O-acetylase OafA/YrhL